MRWNVCNVIYFYVHLSKFCLHEDHTFGRFHNLRGYKKEPQRYSVGPMTANRERKKEKGRYITMIVMT